MAGQSGGAAEAVEHGVTGLVVDRPSNVGDVVAALDLLLSDRALLRQMGTAARQRAVEEFSYDKLAATLHHGLEAGLRGRLDGD